LLTGIGVSVETPKTIQLKAGWNQIGNPYNFDLVWSDVVAANPGLPETFRGYNGGIQNFEDQTLLKAMGGGFINVASPTTLTFPVKKNTGGRVSGVNTLRNPIDATDWEVKFILHQGDIKNMIGGVGMRADASEGFDVYDGISMPRFEKFLDINHAKKIQQYTYSKDVVPAQNNYTWKFEVSASQSDYTSITWDNSYFGSNTLNLILVDETSGVWVDMKKNSSYSFSPDHAFRIVFGDDAYVQSQMEIGTSKILGVYPNPSQGPVNLMLSLAGWEPRVAVNVELMSLMGERVGNIFTGELPSGYHEISWNGVTPNGTRPASGMYLIRLKAGNAVSTFRVVIQ
jgi:hypothetical protein